MVCVNCRYHPYRFVVFYCESKFIKVPKMGRYVYLHYSSSLKLFTLIIYDIYILAYNRIDVQYHLSKAPYHFHLLDLFKLGAPEYVNRDTFDICRYQLDLAA
jgi:hypothetical protein